ncbi:MAG: nucleoid-associated protein [Atopobiaceae bacterium]|jgi:hypothetical protein
MLKISHAILHSFDFETGEKYFSEGELDLSERATKSYVQRTMHKCSASAENKHGQFEEGSPFAEELKLYLSGENGFVPLSMSIAQWFWEEIRKSDDLSNLDLLVVDFEESAKAVSAGAGEEEAQAAFDAEPVRYFALALLPRKQTFMHTVMGQDSHITNDLVKTDATLPSPTQKIDTYAVIDAKSLEIDFHDKERLIGSTPSYIIPDGLLRCTTQASSKEAIETVTRVIEDVAQEYGLNTAESVSKAKAQVAKSIETDETFAPEEVGAMVFEDEPKLQDAYKQRYQESARQEAIPEEVSVKRGVANRMAKNHRIRTDTGIDITFPSEYSSNPTYIAFRNNEDGHIEIVIRNIGKIENR